MIYRKGNQTEKLDAPPTWKVGLIRDGDGEGLWARQGPNYVVLQNNALHFFPFYSWGVVLPSDNPPGELREEIDISHLQPDDGLELHPEAWESYLKNGRIDEKGIPQEEKDD
jgi:hypothetical protein